MKKELLEGLRLAIDQQLGKKVKIKVNRGRHRIDVSEGVLKEAYANVFVVEVDGKEESLRRLSFSYIDVITKDVQMTLV